MLRTFSNVVRNVSTDLTQTVRGALAVPVRGKKQKARGAVKGHFKKLEINNYRRQAMRIQYYDRLQLQTIKDSKMLPEAIRKQARQDLAAMPRESDPHNEVDRCQLTAGHASLVEDYKVNRIIWRQLASTGKVQGVKFWMYPNYSNYDMKKQARRLYLLQHDRYYQKFLQARFKENPKYEVVYNKVKREMEEDVKSDKDWEEQMRMYFAQDKDPLIYY